MKTWQDGLIRLLVVIGALFILSTAYRAANDDFHVSRGCVHYVNDGINVCPEDR